MISRAIVEAAPLPSHGSRAVMDKVAEQLAALPLSDEQRVEVERRLLETKLALFFDRPDATDDVDAAWAGLVALGFANPEREASMRVFMIKNCLMRQLTGQANQHVLMLRGVQEELRNLGMLEAGRAYLGVADALAAKLQDIVRGEGTAKPATKPGQA